MNLLTPLLFSQISDATPHALGDWLVSLAAVMAVVLLALKIIDHFRRKPAIESEFATKLELGRLTDSVDERFEKIEEHIEDIGTELRQAHNDLLRRGEERAEKIHERINHLSQELIGSIAELRGFIGKTIARRSV